MRAQVVTSLTHWERTASGCRARFLFSGELPVFVGHFPGEPLVPGVFLIEAVRLAAERQAGRPLSIAQVVDARFSAPVRPHSEVGLELWFEEQTGRVRCRAEARLGDLVAGKFRLDLVERPDSSDAPV